MNFKSKSFLISLLLISTAFALTVPREPEIGSDEYEIQDYFEPEIIDVQEDRILEGSRSLLAYPRLRVIPNYEHVTEGSEEYKKYVTTQLVPAVVAYFTAALKSKSPVLTPISSTAKTLCGYPTPKALVEGTRGDVIVIINTKYDPTGGWAAATNLCALSSSKRPLIFKVAINTYAMGNIAYPDTNPLVHDLYIGTIVHEFIHGLAMNGVLYKYFIDKSGNFLTDHVKKMEIGGEERTVLDIEPLTTRLRNHYGCNTVPGVIMENQGGAHLERRYFRYEIMSNGATHGSKISEVSLAFLEGTGWYVADYSYAEPYFIGKGQGCEYIFGECDAKLFDEFCEGTQLGCTPVGTSGGYCKSSTKSESCRFYSSQTEFNCENPKGIYYVPFASKQVFGRGLGSRCFSGNLTTKSTEIKYDTYCFTYECQGEGLGTTLIVNFGTAQLTCLTKGPLNVKGYNGHFDCPDPLNFCTTIGKPVCPRNCMGRGTCVEGKCQCKVGFEGTDCGFATTN